VHEHLEAVSERVDPLAERAGEEVSRRYRDAGTSAQLVKDQVADVVNRLNDRELPLEIRWLLTQPYVLVRGLEHAQSQGTVNEDDPTRPVLEFVEEDTRPAFLEALVDAADQEGMLESVAADRGLQPGEINREDLIERLRARGVDIREGHTTESTAEAFRELQDAASSDGGGGIPTGTAAASVAAAGAVAGSQGGGGSFSTGQRPPWFWDIDCALDAPDTGVTQGSPARGDGLVLARTISLLYTFGERQPLFDAMDALRDKVLTGGLLNPLGAGLGQLNSFDQSGISDDELCQLRIWIYSWGQDPDPLTMQKRATVASVIGIPDSASSAPVNVGFARAMDQLVDVLVCLATRCCTDTLHWARPAAEVASLRLAGALQEALTGATFIDVAFWRRQFTIATQVLAHPALRALLGVSGDPDASPAPTIRKVLPGVAFDAAALEQERIALDKILKLAEHLATPGVIVDAAEFQRSANAAVRLRVLTGRLDLSDCRDLASTGASGGGKG
jgi:hypothetical protein